MMIDSRLRSILVLAMACLLSSCDADETPNDSNGALVGELVRGILDMGPHGAEFLDERDLNAFADDDPPITPQTELRFIRNSSVEFSRMLDASIERGRARRLPIFGMRMNVTFRGRRNNEGGNRILEVEDTLEIELCPIGPPSDYECRNFENVYVGQ